MMTGTQNDNSRTKENEMANRKSIFSITREFDGDYRKASTRKAAKAAKADAKSRNIKLRCDKINAIKAEASRRGWSIKWVYDFCTTQKQMSGNDWHFDFATPAIAVDAFINFCLEVYREANDF
jgi:hypothetical protein